MLGIEKGAIGKTQSKNFGGYHGILLLSTHSYHVGTPTIAIVGTSGVSTHYNGNNASITIRDSTIQNTDVTTIYWVFLGDR